MNGIIMMMIGVSIVLFFISLLAFLWAIKNKQFDDGSKFTSLDDSEEALNDALRLEKRKKEALKKERIR